jgi:hypothetical protein
MNGLYGIDSNTKKMKYDLKKYRKNAIGNKTQKKRNSISMTNENIMNGLYGIDNNSKKVKIDYKMYKKNALGNQKSTDRNSMFLVNEKFLNGFDINTYNSKIYKDDLKYYKKNAFDSKSLKKNKDNDINDMNINSKKQNGSPKKQMNN